MHHRFQTVPSATTKTLHSCIKWYFNAKFGAPRHTQSAGSKARSRIHQRSPARSSLPAASNLTSSSTRSTPSYATSRQDRTYPVQKHQNTSREVHFIHLLTELILVIPSRFPRLAKATYILHSHFLETYFHHTYTKPLLYTNSSTFSAIHLHFFRHLRTPIPENFWPYAARNHFFENWNHRILRSTDKQRF